MLFSTPIYQLSKLFEIKNLTPFVDIAMVTDKLDGKLSFQLRHVNTGGVRGATPPPIIYQVGKPESSRDI